MVIGLTGGIGMGKSTAAATFRRLGLPVFDADATVHRLQAKGGRAVPLIGRLFPDAIVNGTVDRPRLRSAVMNDPAALARLEAVVHPLVRSEQAKFIGRARRDRRRAVVLDVPLLLETGGEKRCDAVVVVSAPRATQLARVRRRGRMPDEVIAKIIARQMPDAEKRRRADHVVMTGLSRHHAVRHIRRMTKDLLRR